MTTKKYKLHAAANGEKATCAFFASPEGCRNGDNCKFSHTIATASDKGTSSTTKTTTPLKIECSSSVISSESEGDVPPVAKPTPTNKNSAKKNKTNNNDKTKSTPLEEKKTKKKKRRGDSDIFAKPKGDPLSPAPAKKRKLDTSSVKKTQNQEQPSKYNKSHSNNQTPSKPITTKKSMPNNTNNNRKQKQNEETPPDFRSLNLPVASFSVMPPKKEAEKSPAPKNANDSNNNEEKKKTSLPALPLPIHSEIGRKWKNIVIETREHKSYSTCYDFEKWKQLDEERGVANAAEWVKARPWGEWCKDNPQTIAIDCEMCETKDPVTGNLNHKALCRLSVVNADNPEEPPLLDTLVKPDWPVTNYRTFVNGIKKEDLDNVQFTLRHAQAFMLALCSEETVIVGQSLENDLCALRMEHHCNADSANLFVAKDDNNSTPSLKDIAKAVLNEDMPETHDSVNDAIIALRCVEFYMEHDGKVEPVERTTNVRNKFASSQLFVHRIPKICSTDHLESLFLNHTWISPLKIDDIELTGQNGKTVVTFKSARHANLAFFTLEGDQDSDSSGRAQKKVFLRSGGYIRVRKMVHDRKKSKEETKDVESEN